MSDLNQPRVGDIYAEDASGEGHIIPNLSIAPYTPTTEEVRHRYCSEVFAEDDAEFDRWLAEHDRQVAEKAWGQGAAANIVSTVMNGSRGIPLNPYRQGEEQNV